METTPIIVTNATNECQRWRGCALKNCQITWFWFLKGLSLIMTQCKNKNWMIPVSFLILSIWRYSLNKVLERRKVSQLRKSTLRRILNISYQGDCNPPWGSRQRPLLQLHSRPIKRHSWGQEMVWVQRSHNKKFRSAWNPERSVWRRGEMEILPNAGSARIQQGEDTQCVFTILR